MSEVRSTREHRLAYKLSCNIGCALIPLYILWVFAFKNPEVKAGAGECWVDTGSDVCQHGSILGGGPGVNMTEQFLKVFVYWFYLSLITLGASCWTIIFWYDLPDLTRLI